MDMNDIQINDVMIDVDMDGMELGATSTEAYSDPSEADYKKIITSSYFWCIHSILTWDGSVYDLMHLAILEGSHLSLDIELSLAEDKSDSCLTFPPSKDYTSLVRSLQVREGNQATNYNILDTNDPLGCFSVHPLTRVDVSSESIILSHQVIHHLVLT